MKTVPLDQKVVAHAVREHTINSTQVDAIAEALGITGYCVAPSGMGEPAIRAAKNALDAIYEKQATDVGGEHRLRMMNDANIARAVCAYDRMFVDMAMLPIIQDVSKRVLGPYVTLMSQNGIINQPGTDHYQFTWHRDLNYQHFTSSRMIALSALVALDPFDHETGGTYVLPASHKTEAFPSEEYVRSHQQVVNANPGDIIFFDSMLYHRTGENRSRMIRRAVNHIIVPPFIKQQYSFPKMLAGQGIQDDATLQFLGFGMETADDVISWRMAKIQKAEATHSPKSQVSPHVA